MGTHIKETPVQIPFMYLGNKEIYCIFLEMLCNLCFIIHKMLFISYFYLFIFK